MLCNAVGDGRVSDFPEKKRYQGLRFNIISVKRGWVGECRISRKIALRNT